MKKNPAKNPGYRRGVPLAEYGILRPWLTIPIRRTTLPALLCYLAVVIRDFFTLQYCARRGPTAAAVVPVDHPLDALVPFRPDLAALYLDFINYWIRPFSMALRRYPGKKGLCLCRDFLTLLRVTYREAARVYRFRLSTTARPPCTTPLICRIRRIDPHLLCVPSLHVAILALTWAYWRDVLNAEGRAMAEDLWAGALNITESVLYVKQHSVNCISAALHMTNRLIPTLFTPADAVSFIDALFREAPDITAEAQGQLREYMRRLFDRFQSDPAGSSDWAQPVKDWLAAWEAAPH
ncbi:MAG: hypothetical protein LBS64_05900 [Spirochaetaceae bacterium]|jgi:hypothetical protein|nr:hypothetical protein [Spirochaetaceae bacterium]